MDALLLILPVAIVAFILGRVTASKSRGYRVPPYRPNSYKMHRDFFKK